MKASYLYKDTWNRERVFINNTTYCPTHQVQCSRRAKHFFRLIRNDSSNMHLIYICVRIIGV